MESRRSNKRKSSLVDEEDVVAEEPEVIYNIVDRKPAAVKLQLRIDAKVKLSGSVTGELYIWERAGAIVEVDEKDSLELLNKRLGKKSCCGGSRDGLKVFELIEE